MEPTVCRISYVDESGIGWRMMVLPQLLLYPDVLRCWHEWIPTHARGGIVNCRYLWYRVLATQVTLSSAKFGVMVFVAFEEDFCMAT